MVSATPLGLAFYDFLISNVKKENNKQTSVPRKKENTVWELVMILSQTAERLSLQKFQNKNTGVFAAYDIFIHSSVQTLGLCACLHKCTRGCETD